jgi:hypothetical protein
MNGFGASSAAIQLANEGKSTRVGKCVEYIFTNSGHTNPPCRVTPRHFIEEGKDFEYDKEKYREIPLEAAETVLGYFGFDRTIYGDSAKKNKKWYYHLMVERRRDIETESMD